MPGNQLRAKTVIRFGSFEADLHTQELRKRGILLRLPGQSFQVLQMLLERGGGLVTREELRAALWPSDTFVDFDHGLHAAVSRLREVLGDSAENPNLVETLPRRGYRFIGQVEPKASSPAGAVTPSVAVLPFVNISGETENEYFSDGLAEELINELTHVPGLKVIARTSAFAFKGKGQDIREIARALGVEHVVEGSVRRAGARVRITAQLIAASDRTHLWSERFDREMADIFTVQDEIAQSIATALRVHLTCSFRRYVPSLPAYETYLKARYCLAAFTCESLPRSRDFYEHAIAMDAGFAPAHSGLAMALVSLVLPGIAPARIAMPLARAAAERALNIDPASQEAHAVLGMVAALYDFDWKEAECRFRLAIAGEPISPYVRWYYSFSYLLPMGRARESVRQCMQGLQDDPLNFMGGFHYAGALLAGGKTEAGEAYLRQLSEFHLSLYQPYYLLALSRAVQGMHKEALAAAEKAYSLASWSTTTKGLFGGLLKFAGETDRADQWQRELLSGEQYGAAMGASLFCVGCAEMDAAAEWVEKAVEQRDTRTILLMGLVRASRPDLLRSEGKWSAIARTLGIPHEVLAN